MGEKKTLKKKFSRVQRYILKGGYEKCLTFMLVQ
jgi:hypothetical protein